ncbi:hypothetical protein C8R47DRAFT_428481 [Mycena vitilis]|nr:hypothetical protein C8R47DRAFT_428481 [Mycena vitilis]
MAASTATPTLHKCIEKEIRKTILASSKTPIQSCITDHGLSDRLSRASDAELERYDKLGQLGLYICFINTLFLEPVGERPVGHFKALHDRVLSRETLALVMQNADVDCTITNTNVLVEALQVFVGALFRKKDLTTVLFWFRGVFLPIITAADSAYVKWHR